MANTGGESRESLWELTAKDLMQSEVVTVTPWTDNRELAQLFADKKITGVPVVDGGGDLVGVVSVTDLARLAITARPPTKSGAAGDESGRHYNPVFRGFPVGSREPGTVAEIMSNTPVTAPENLPISQLAALMVEKHVHRVIITSNKKVVGIATSLDLLQPLVDRGVIDDAQASEGSDDAAAADSSVPAGGEKAAES